MTEISERTIYRQIDEPINPVPGINGLTNADRLSMGVETKLYLPESPNPLQGLVLIPGFGHTVGTIGVNFTQHGEAFASGLGLTTAVSVIDTRDDHKRTHWSLLPGELFAPEDALALLQLPAHVLAFSRSCSRVLQTCAEISRHGQILPLTLVAPALRGRIVDIFKSIGSPVEEFVDDQGPGLAIGNRRTIVPTALQHSTPESIHREIQALRDYSESLTQTGVSVTVFAAQSDPTVRPAMVSEFAEAAGIPVIWVNPVDTPVSAIHDFGSAPLRRTILDHLRDRLITSPKSFTPVTSIFQD